MIDDEEKGLTYNGAYMTSFKPNNTKILFPLLMNHIRKLILVSDLGNYIIFSIICGNEVSLLLSIKIY